MGQPDRLYFGGEIVTGDGTPSAPEALAVRDGTILHVGDRLDCRQVLGAGFEPVDLRGAALLPGFIDTHMHPVAMVYYDMNRVLREAGTIEEIQEALRAEAAGKPPGRWVVGLDFDEQGLADPRLPSRHDLDAACPGHPVLLIKHDGHMVIANTPAIQRSGVTEATPDPDGGAIDREPGGFPAGPFREAASQIPLSALPPPDLQEMEEAAARSFRRLAGCGVTTIGAVLQAEAEGPLGAPGALEPLALEALLGHVTVRLYGMLIAGALEQVERLRASALHRPGRAGHRIGAVKIYADGTFGSCTAFMQTPFSDAPDSRGYLTRSEEDIYRRMRFAHRAGLQIAVHAIGDAAIRTCIDLYAHLLREHPRADHRHRIEHASVLDAGMLRDMARLGLAASCQPLFIHSEKAWLDKRLGPERTPRTYPFRAILDAGVLLAGASDCPVESTDVLHALQCCVTREGFEPAQSIRIEEALRMYTVDAARALFMERETGTLRTGLAADLTILSENPLRVPPERLRDIGVLQTFCGGKRVYSI